MGVREHVIAAAEVAARLLREPPVAARWEQPTHLQASATDAVIDLLTRLSVRRHGPAAVVQALSRAERAPATITPF